MINEYTGVGTPKIFIILVHDNKKYVLQQPKDK